jgi:hypothetical protein
MARRQRDNLRALAVEECIVPDEERSGSALEAASGHIAAPPSRAMKSRRVK